MTFKIFNCYNGFVEVDVGQKEIDFIVVTVVQGCEIIHIYFKDGTSVEVDSCGVFDGLFRTVDFYDDTYVVKTDRLSKWIDIGEKHENPVKTRQSYFSSIDSIDSLDETVNGVKIAQSKRRDDDGADDLHAGSSLERIMNDIAKYKTSPIIEFTNIDESDIDFQKLGLPSYRIIGEDNELK